MNIDPSLIRSVCKALARKRRVNRVLPLGGKIVIDHVLPFICIYRFHEKPDPRFLQLIRTQASYLIVSEQVPVTEMVSCIAAAVSRQLHSFMVIELWPDRDFDSKEFNIYSPASRAPATVKALRKGFEEMNAFYPMVTVHTREGDRRHPNELAPIFSLQETKEHGLLLIGISVPRVYQEPVSGKAFAIFFRKFKAKFSDTIKKAVFEFIRVQTSNEFEHYLMLGKTNLDNLIRFADQQLADISERMNFLMRVTPVNDDHEWEAFRKSHFTKAPKFSYRLIALDPEAEKRKLYKIRLEKIDDPTLAHIFRDKRLELEKQLTMLEERETRSFRYIGQSLYGDIDPAELDIAKHLLNQEARHEASGELVDAQTFAQHAQEEMDRYRLQFPGMDIKIQIRKDISGVMVSKAHLLIGENFTLPKRRIEALVQHEVGTHVVTYCNGYQQPLKQMYAGLAAYDQLQEGLAVLSEYLVDGLTIDRLRVLAGRVVAVNSMINGAEFIETFRLLHKIWDFEPKAAYNITMRVYRGGGLTKDSVYLTGFIRLLQYLEKKGDWEVLYTGKFHLKHVPVIEELMHRNILKKPYIGPTLRSVKAQRRLEHVRRHPDVIQLLNYERYDHSIHH